MLNKLVLRALFSVSLAFSFVGVTNAALITQDIISDTKGVIGSITINTWPAEDAGDGLSNVFVWEEFSIWGWDMQAPAIADGFQFFATFDSTDLTAGIQDLYFDLDDDYAAYPYAYSGSVGDIFNSGATGYVNVFDDNPSAPVLEGFYTDVYLGKATVVPTPATLVLFLTAIAGLASRRKKS
ncbi:MULTISPECIES: PEP-CTERM sorting domain-containing protein [Colwellia]|uniref:PEP-CTERM protein-sorting domain-containing protein n=1 Tax=Colwellia marinimaniae TaxID=1513592 RepID=A0ABQ0MZX8_9GAMM|nr:MULTISPECIES: PEP-CTERM sorting domain-containing protein [Colwellia]GAW97852.1 hypothetical protein MTCD1_03500 [Colwellia marinimaniae]